jgi:hypothetical protein
MHRTASALLAFLATVTCAAQEASVSAAAKTYYPSAIWQERSVLMGDFSCHGRQEVAILGASAQFIVVAIFTRGLGAEPVILKYSTKVRNAKSTVLTKESRDFEQGDGNEPEGYTPSKTCSGLNLADGEVDSAHIYWDTKYQRFLDWSL